MKLQEAVDESLMTRLMRSTSKTTNALRDFNDMMDHARATHYLKNVYGWPDGRGKRARLVKRYKKLIANGDMLDNNDFNNHPLFSKQQQRAIDKVRKLLVQGVKNDNADEYTTRIMEIIYEANLHKTMGQLDDATDGLLAKWDNKYM